MYNKLIGFEDLLFEILSRRYSFKHVFSILVYSCLFTVSFRQKQSIQFENIRVWKILFQKLKVFLFSLFLLIANLLAKSISVTKLNLI